MSVALKTPMSLEGFLDWESRQELKYEFDGFQPVAMVGVSNEHSVIQGNLLTALITRLRGATVVHDPVVVFEILGPGTSYTDRIEKNREYRATPSIRRYVILEQSRAAATVYTRSGAEWLTDILIDDGDLALPEAGISILLNEIYEGVEFPPDARPAESG